MALTQQKEFDDAVDVFDLMLLKESNASIYRRKRVYREADEMDRACIKDPV